MRKAKQVAALLVGLSLATVAVAQFGGGPGGGPGGFGGGPGAGGGAPRGRGGFGAPGPGMFGGGGQLQSVMEDVRLLNTFVSLQLTDEQLAGILDVYANVPAPTDERLATLLQMRQKLVQGNPLTQADQQALAALFQPQPNQRPQMASNPQGEAIWALLSTQQQAALVAGGMGGGFRGAGGRGGDGQQWDRSRTLDFLTRLNAAMDTIDEAAWPARRDALANAMAVSVGATEGQDLDNKKAIFADYLEKMWQMPGADFEGKKNELAASLEALMPQGSSMALAYVYIDPQFLTMALNQSFLHYKAQGLLKEMQAARQAAAQ